ncbi:MAG: hypothetical protein DRO12_02125 [Thermoprotei archaeon]|nr:MAG: hypothetical protein DRO12_02125 [Thermoprotei archaeon]
MIPGSLRFTRGKATFAHLAIAAHDLGADRAVIVSNRKGNPAVIDIYRLVFTPKTAQLFNLEKICRIVLKGVKLSREAKHVQRFDTRNYNAYISYTEDKASERLVECFTRGLYFHVFGSSKPLRPYIIAEVISKPEAYLEVRFRTDQGVCVGPIIRVGRVELCTR